jgi:glycogen(starch) synthase
MLRALDEEYGLPASTSRVIPNGCAVRARSTGRDAKEPLVLAAGRLWDEAKNIDSLGDVAAGLSWPVAVAGDARDPSGRCRRLRGVKCLGRLPDGEMTEWYERASIYALPARYEPFGLSVLEAAAAGCALVLGDIRSLRENWDGAAVFVPPDNRRALAAAIEALIDDPARRDDLAARARGRAARFTVTRMAREYMRAYADVLG